MDDGPPETLVLDRRIAPAELGPLVHGVFGDMVKYVVDMRQRVIAIGGELHADAEQVLLARVEAVTPTCGGQTTIRAAAPTRASNSRR